MKSPRVSVIIPTHNRSDSVGWAIQTVLKQTETDLEVIVVNDGSTDDTEKLLKAWSRCDSRLRHVTIPNSGLAAARNVGITSSRGKYLAFLDDDDWWRRDKLAKQLRLFKTSKYRGGLGLVYCWHYWVNGRSKIEGELKISKRGDVFPEIIKGNMICGSGSAALVKKECFEKVGIFNNRLKLAEDWDMWIRIANRYFIDFVPEPLVYIRRWRNRTARYLLRLLKYSFFVDWRLLMLVLKTPKRRSWKNLWRLGVTRFRADTKFIICNFIIKIYYLLLPGQYMKRLLYSFYKSKRLTKFRRRLKGTLFLKYK